MTAVEALAELRSCSGSQVDPAVVEAFATTVARREPAYAAGRDQLAPAAKL